MVPVVARGQALAALLRRSHLSAPLVRKQDAATRHLAQWWTVPHAYPLALGRGLVRSDFRASKSDCTLMLLVAQLAGHCLSLGCCTLNLSVDCHVVGTNAFLAVEFSTTGATSN